MGGVLKKRHHALGANVTRCERKYRSWRARLVLILFMSLHDALECKTNSITRYESRVCIGASAHRRPPLHTKHHQKAIDVTGASWLDNWYVTSDSLVHNCWTLAWREARCGSNLERANHLLIHAVSITCCKNTCVLPILPDIHVYNYELYVHSLDKLLQVFNLKNAFSAWVTFLTPYFSQTTPVWRNDELQRGATHVLGGKYWCACPFAVVLTKH